MGFDFLTDLSNMQVEIPPEVSRLAGFFVLLQGGMIYLQKKNNPAKDIWEDLSWVFLVFVSGADTIHGDIGQCPNAYRAPCR